MDNDHKHTSKVVVKSLKAIKVKVLEWPSQSPHPIEICGQNWKRVCEEEAYKPDLATPALSGEMDQNSPNLLWEAGGRLPEMFDPN